MRWSVPLALAVLLALSALAPAARAQGLPDGFFAVNGGGVETSPARETHLARMAELGIDAVRSPILWNLLERRAPVDGVRTFDWAPHDDFVEAMARHGLTWRPLLAHSPYWNRSVTGSWQSAPADPPSAAGVAAALLERYGTRGTFWAGRPSLVPRPVRWIEAWNEPNHAPGRTGRLRFPPADYARFLRAMAEGAHSVDEGAQVVVGGLVALTVSDEEGLTPRDFLAAVAAADPGVAAMTQGVAVHIFGTDPVSGLRTMGRTREQVDATAFAGTPIHVNETGTYVRPADALLGEPARAAFLEAMAAGAAAASGPRCNVASIAPFTWVAQELDLANIEHWFGIATIDGAPRLSATRYAAAIAGAVPGDAACSSAPPVPAAAPAPAAGPAAPATVAPAPVVAVKEKATKRCGKGRRARGKGKRRRCIRTSGRSRSRASGRGRAAGRVR